MRAIPRRETAKSWVIAVLAGLAGICAGCGPGESPGSSDSQAGDRSFQVRGVVRELPKEGGTIVVKHEEIPGYMPRMTMELTVLNTNELAGLKPGDSIEFRLVARTNDHFIDGIRRLATADAGVASTPAPATAPTLLEANGGKGEALEEGLTLEPGDPAPDVAVRLETGEEVRISKWRGSVVAMTFFFTRCPLPDFCPRMNLNFQETRELLLRDPSGPTNWVFLSLSFDSDFDQPKVLRGHGDLYRGTNAAGWWFGALGASGLAVVKPAFDLMIGREGGSFSHNLRTVVLDPEGRVSRQFDGNRWTAADLAAAMTAASRGDDEKPPRSR